MIIVLDSIVNIATEKMDTETHSASVFNSFLILFSSFLYCPSYYFVYFVILYD